MLAADPEQAVPLLLVAVGDTPKRTRPPLVPNEARLGDGPLTVEHLARALRDTVGDEPVSLPHLPLSWHRPCCPFPPPPPFPPPSARFPWERRRGRARRRARPYGRRGARAEGNRAHSGRHLRRRRLPDGRHGALDGDALPHSAAHRGREQSIVLQRRSAPGAR